jgi:hypothetical protein
MRRRRNFFAKMIECGSEAGVVWRGGKRRSISAEISVMRPYRIIRHTQKYPLVPNLVFFSDRLCTAPKKLKKMVEELRSAIISYHPLSTKIKKKYKFRMTKLLQRGQDIL